MPNEPSVAIEIPESLFTRLEEFLRTNGVDTDPTEAIQLAISSWISHPESGPNKLELEPSGYSDAGYYWDRVFLAAGTKLRVRSEDAILFALVLGNAVTHAGKNLSPAEFATLAIGDDRDGWREVWIKRPEDREWQLADNLRRLRVDPVPSPEVVATSNAISKARPIGRTRGSFGYRDDILQALRNLGGGASRLTVVEEVRRIRRQRGATLPVQFEATVQHSFEVHCIDSSIFCGRPDYGLFQWPNGKGEGTWSIVADAAARYERQRDK